MTPRLVFIHGGMHTGRCWADTVAAVCELRPDIPLTVVNFPGRADIPGDLADITIEECVAAVTKQVDHPGAGTDAPLVLVGHSLAGVILSGVLEQLEIERVQQVIFIACCVPSLGESALDTLPSVLRSMTKRILKRSPVFHKFPPGWIRYVLGNHATPEQRAKINAGLVPESAALATGVVTAGWPESVRKSWVLTSRDRALPPRKQRICIRKLGDVDDVVPVDAGHEVMITHPSELALVLLQLAGCLATIDG